MTKAQKINIAIASPGDVKEERQAVHSVFNRWNDRHDDEFLHAIVWETASVPALGGNPQSILNPRIIDRSDLLIAIFWHRLGTPTDKAESGTVEEIYEFIGQKGPQRVMLYFCSRDIPSSVDASELRRLQKFKDEMRTKGLYHEYGTVEEFERDLYSHLEVKVDQFLTGSLPTPESPTTALESKPQETDKSTLTDVHPDPRLRQPFYFGDTPQEIASGLLRQMDAFDAIDGCTPDKYLDLGSHVYASAAAGLDRYIEENGQDHDEATNAALARISTRLKKLAHNNKRFVASQPSFWSEGREIARTLEAQASHMERIIRW